MYNNRSKYNFDGIFVEIKGFVKYSFKLINVLINKLFYLVKIQIEIEKIKYELNKQYKILGKYISSIQNNHSVSDFTHDKEFHEIVNEINSINLYLKQKKLSKQNSVVLK